MSIFFTSDQHYGHINILKYCNRPFPSAKEMDEKMIANHNQIVKSDDVVYIVGDFTLGNFDFAVSIIKRLSGNLVFLQGSHEKWWWRDDLYDGRVRAVSPIHVIEPDKANGLLVPIVLCHYAMRSWSRSHYASWHLFGHHHGRLPPFGLSFDVGVDTHHFYPWSLDEVAEKMKTLMPIVDYSKRSQ